MNKKSFLFLFVVVMLKSLLCFSQDADLDSGINKSEVCRHFSMLIGEEIDSLPNPDLYLFVYDWLGSPYKYAGDCKTGVDCSGFVNQLYDKIYKIPLAGSSRDIFKETSPVKRNALQEGDLVFFKIRKHRISHVGIYLMNNKFVHSSVKQGVIISDLNEPYYRKYFFKGGRILKGLAEKSD